MDSIKTPSYLTAQRRVQWNPVDKKVEKDSLKHDQLLAMTKASFEWEPAATYTTGQWRQESSSLPQILRAMSQTRREHARAEEAAARAEAAVALRERLRHAKPYAHTAKWNDSPHAHGNGLWRSPDPTKNEPPDFNFRPRFKYGEGQAPWLTPDDFANASQNRVLIAGVPQPAPRTINSCATTESYQVDNSLL